MLYMSGYTDDKLGHLLEPDGELALMQKPFYINELVKKIRELLDRQSAPRWIREKTFFEEHNRKLTGGRNLRVWFESCRGGIRFPGFTGFTSISLWSSPHDRGRACHHAHDNLKVSESFLKGTIGHGGEAQRSG